MGNLFKRQAIKQEMNVKGIKNSFLAFLYGNLLDFLQELE